MVKATEVQSNGLVFDDGSKLYSEHDQDCCEHHFLSFDDLTLSDFDGLEFDLSLPHKLFERVEGYGIRLIPVNGHPVSVPGYGYNNGYYSANLTLVIYDRESDETTEFDVTKCQAVTD